MAGRLSRVNVLTVAFTGVLGLVAIYESRQKGVLVGPGMLAAVALAGVLLVDGRRAALVIIALPIVAEDDPGNGISLFPRFYQHLFAKSSLIDFLILFGLIAALFDALRWRDLRSVRPFGWVLGLLFASLLMGFVTGQAGGGVRFKMLSTFQTTIPLFAVPFLVVNTIRTRTDLKRALTFAGGLGVLKGLTGLFVVFAGLAAPEPGVGRLTYYQPTGNIVTMIFLLAALAAFLTRARLPRWMWWGSPFVFACLVLSYRRTFWLAAVACLAITGLVASGRVGRRFVIPVIGALALTGYLVLSTGLATGLQGSVVRRAASINPTSITHNQEDRYRLAERRNVLAALEAQPITGLGIGVDWPERYPVNLTFQDGGDFVHMAVLWWWMKTGILGIAAYLALILSLLVVGVRTFRRHPDPVVRVWCLAFGIGAIGIAIADLASTLPGPDGRAGTVIGAMMGLLAVAARDARAGADSPGRLPA